MKPASKDKAARGAGTLKVIGIGQSLRGDDAAGLEAVRQWRSSSGVIAAHANVQVELAEAPGIDLLGMLEGCRAAILVDAMQGVGQPGTIQILAEDQLSSFTADSGSVHGWGVAETLALGRQLNPATLPQRIILIGIETGQVELGASLSPAVEANLPECVRLIEQSVLELLQSG